MQISKFSLILIVFLAIGLGSIMSPFIINKVYLSTNFFSFRFIELLRLIVMVFLGFYVAYWVHLKTDSMQRRKDLCLNLIDECLSMLTEQKNLTIGFVEGDDKEQGKIVLSGFKKINNKIHTIDRICKKISNNYSTEALSEKFIALKSQFGDNYYSGFNEESKQLLKRDFDNYEKLLDDLRIEIIS